MAQGQRGTVSRFQPCAKDLVMPTLPPTVLVLASGRGERFVASGGTGSKLAALLDGKPVLARTLDAVRASGLPWHLEDQGHAGMGDSIAAAVRATPDAAGWLVLPGDLPLVQPRTLQAVATALALHAVVLPCYRGQRGHPVGFAASCREALLALHGPQGAAPVVRAQAAANAVVHIELDDAGMLTDIDTVQDLAKAQRLLAASRSPSDQ
jgi:molybdenum cofactor cytidylyltransferase